MANSSMHYPTRPSTGASTNRPGKHCLDFGSTHPAAGGNESTMTVDSIPVGVHEATVYRSVAADLPVDEPVLHSVVHTHRVLARRQLRNLRGTAVSEAVTTSDQPTTSPGATRSPTVEDHTARLQSEIQQIDDVLHVWKVQRYSEYVSASERDAATTQLEAEMAQRLSERRVAEQDRAIRRIQRIVETLAPKLCDSIRDNAASMQQDEEDAQQRKIAASDPSANHLPVNTAARLELARHDQQRQERVHHRLQEVRQFSVSWMVERDIRLKYEHRASCEQLHLLGSYTIVQEETVARRALLEHIMDLYCRVGLEDDEREFREELLSAEDARRVDVMDYMLRAMGHLFLEDEEGESTDSETEVTEVASPISISGGYPSDHPHDPVEPHEVVENQMGQPSGVDQKRERSSNHSVEEGDPSEREWVEE